MRGLHRLVYAGVAAALLVPGANALVIDDFTSGAFSNSMTSGAQVHFQNGTMVGGDRLVYMLVNSNPFNQFMDVTINPGGGFAVASTGTGLVGTVELGYGYAPDGGGGYVFDPLNLDLSSYDRFQIDFLANDQNLDMVVLVRDTSNNASLFNFVVAGGMPNNPFSVDVLFSDLVGSASLANVSQIVFGFTTAPGGDFALGSLQAVPEPATLAALGVGALALMRRRRSKK